MVLHENKLGKIVTIDVLLMCFGNLLYVYGLTSFLYNLRHYFQGVVLICALINIVIMTLSKKSLQFRILDIFIVMFFMYILAVDCLNSALYVNLANEISNAIFSLLVFWTILNFANKYDVLNNSKFIDFATVFFFIIYFYFHINPTQNASSYSIFHAQFSNSIYYVLIIVLFWLAENSFKKRVFCLVVAVICTLVSAKQTALIALLLSTIFYIVCEYNIKSKKGSSRLFKIIIGFLLVALFFSISYRFLFSNYNFNVFRGIESAFEDGGNGRIDIYSRIIERMQSSTIMQFLFGHGGTGAVAFDIGISAHNDFFEVFYDLGIIGFIFYIGIVLSVVKYGVKMYRAKVYYAPAFISSIVLFLVISMFSHLIFILKYFMILVVFWGVYIGKWRYEIESINDSTE